MCDVLLIDLIKSDPFGSCFLRWRKWNARKNERTGLVWPVILVCLWYTLLKLQICGTFVHGLVEFYGNNVIATFVFDMVVFVYCDENALVGNLTIFIICQSSVLRQCVHSRFFYIVHELGVFLERNWVIFIGVGIRIPFESWPKLWLPLHSLGQEFWGDGCHSSQPSDNLVQSRQRSNLYRVRNRVHSTRSNC